MLRATVIDRTSPCFPNALRAGDGPATERLWAVGNLELLERPLLALFCSIQCPGSAIVRSYDLARTLRDRGVLLLSPFPARQRRPTQALAEQRNHMVGALAAHFPAAHAAPGSKTERLGRDLLDAGKPGYVVDAQADRHLVDAGARVLDEPQMAGLWTEKPGKLLGGGGVVHGKVTPTNPNVPTFHEQR